MIARFEYGETQFRSCTKLVAQSVWQFSSLWLWLWNKRRKKTKGLSPKYPTPTPLCLQNVPRDTMCFSASLRGQSNTSARARGCLGHSGFPLTSFEDSERAVYPALLRPCLCFLMFHLTVHSRAAISANRPLAAQNPLAAISNPPANARLFNYRSS